MKKFSCGEKKNSLKLAKYFIFSLIFVFMCLVGVNQKVSAYGVAYSHDGNTNPFSPNDSTKTSGITTINGALGNQCNAAIEGNSLAYTLTRSSYSGNKNKNECIAYTDNGTQYFYLQATDSNTNTITFTVKAASIRFNYVTVFEPGHSKSESATFDYDQHEWDSTNLRYNSQRLTSGSSTAVGTIDFSSNNGKFDYTFTYEMRDATYGFHTVNVYFYTAEPDANNETEMAKLNFTLAKPINDYTFSAYSGVTGSDTCDLSNYVVCLSYYPQPSHTGTSTFTIRMNNSAAFYFSTINTHGASGTIENVENYNTVYAVNTFYNEGEENNANKKIQYHYFNVADGSTYNYAVTTTAGYTFTLTIDASGNYKFFLEDIFENTLDSLTHETDTDNIQVNDISNRDLTIYYLAYNSNGTVANSGENISDFEFVLNNLTNDNVKFGLEFYYKVSIRPEYAVTYATPGAGQTIIKMNPLYYNTSDNSDLDVNGNHSKQLNMGPATSNLSYYCRTNNPGASVVEDYGCVAVGGASNFTSNKLSDAKNISANTNTGLKAVANTGTFANGLITGGDISDARLQPNRTDVEVNENGKYLVNIQDVYGNTKRSTIDVAIIDQLNPVITANGAGQQGVVGTEIANYICSSMYVIGGGWETGRVIQNYPTHILTNADCGSGNSVTYNNFAAVDTSQDTEKQTTIRLTITRNGTQASSQTSTNGFYNTGTSAVSFNYLDAIRIGLIRVTDSVTSYSAASFEKSIYEKTNDTYTAYALYTKLDGLDATNITSTLTRNPYNNAQIIANNYIQYSSELNQYRDGQWLTFEIYLINKDGTIVDNDLICSSVDETHCNNIVNAYIDKAISFAIRFTAKDYVGNNSLPVTVKVNVVDDTTPGLATRGGNDSLTGDPVIAKNNLDTDCRLEIGSVIQNKAQLLECYQITSNSGAVYNFVDNATTYDVIRTSDYSSSIYYTNILYAQLYGKTEFTELYHSYDESIKVFVCSVLGATDCTTNGGTWVEIQATTTKTFPDAGSYQIKFEISDTGKNYRGTYNVNKTIIIGCYYVNPRVLLVRPIKNEKDYGAADPIIDYCVYATTNTNAFYINLFKNTTIDTYQFIASNYESANGIVYCTRTITDDTSAVTADIKQILAIGSTNNTTYFTGNLARTYATGVNRKSLGYNGYNAYEDAGYYYITLGNLGISEHQNNYVLRLHPSYLVDDEMPDQGLINYNDVDRNADVNDNTIKYGETISNVLFTIKQVPLTVNANGGSKIYGNKDTNYSQAFNTSASTNISNLTYYTNKEKTATSQVNISTAGYLNGFAVAGLINNGTSAALNDYGHNDYGHYTNIISGYLRREAGENVGVYYICNKKEASAGSVNEIQNAWTHTACDINGFVLQTLGTSIELTTSNVYKDYAGANHVENVSEIIYGRYVKVGTIMYKLTRNNSTINGTTKTFNDYMAANVWRYNYDDSDYSLKIIANSNNANQNYYILYNDALYNINPQTLYVQPGMNQGKEYSNPEHNDPLFEIVVYGETLSITSSVNGGASFNGFTASIAAVGYPHSTPIVYSDAPYNNTTNSKVADTALYFSDRRTITRSVTATYTYKFDSITLVDNKFTMPQNGVTYIYDGSSICPVKLKVGSPATIASYTDECIASGGFIGVNKVVIEDNKAIITWAGALTYQDYALFTSSSIATNETDIVGGSGYITRTNGLNVNWYNYVYTPEGLHVRNNSEDSSKRYCSVTNYQYSVANNGEGTINCANYNVSWTDNAPTKNESEYITATTGSEYLHDGTNYCNDTNVYSYGCGLGVTNIKFSIFKRNIILSFNAASEVYGNVYNFFFGESGSMFTIRDNTTSVPRYTQDGDATKIMLTCYRKYDEATSNYYTVNGVKYISLSDSDCENVDFGLSSGDTWGNDGLKLRFYLNSAISSKFTGTYYPIPAGTYYVYAAIGNDSGVHDNYKLIYIDYNLLLGTSEANNVVAPTVQKDGTLEITSRPVVLYGTYYQKEFGQARYSTYGVATTTPTYTAPTLEVSDTEGAFTAVLANSMSVSIFDDYFYYCNNSAVESYNSVNVTYGCAINTTIRNGRENAYIYSNHGNIYGYTIESPDSNKRGVITLAGGNIDEIIVNFAGTPVRASARQTTNDNFGLLDQTGYYEISLSAITPVVAQYADVTFTVEAGTLYRTTNYSIDDRHSGGLYITPAIIGISVTDGQTKMYGCAYNTLNTSVSNTYTYGEGYSNCVEDVQQYYDLGYEYKVTGDKANYLKANNQANLLAYTDANACMGDSNIANRMTASSCQDIVYPTSGSENGLNYTVTPTFNGSYASGKPTETSLNSGTLYRIFTGENTSISYKYGEYFNNATSAQLAPDNANVLYQDQRVGNYAITLGNLDASFNNKKQCDATSVPGALVDGSGASYCKNFVVKYGNNNTRNHYSTTKNENVYTDSINDGSTFEFTLTVAAFDFTITTRAVVVTTEYNYKVYGDTEPTEGYTCLDLKHMYTYPTGSWYNLGFDYAGRDYCSNDTDFIATGAARFYAIDNSLAKAPWTEWNDNVTYKRYNDTLYDVLTSTSNITRAGQGGNDANVNDQVGRYNYAYHLTTNASINGSNYTISYLVSNATTGNNTSTASSVGFAITRNNGDDVLNGLIEYDRWYQDANHHCIIGTNGTDNCESYTGTQNYRFNVNGITYYMGSGENNTFSRFSVTNGSDTITSELVSNVYFEIVRREIFVQTLAVTKDYGFEENYNDFNVALCSDYNETTAACTPIAKTNRWGVRNSLSNSDYEKFYPSDTFSQANFKGSGLAATYRGNTTSVSEGNFARAFGIYFYRTYGENVGEYVIAACPTQAVNDLACRNHYAGITSGSGHTDEENRLASIMYFYNSPDNTYNASNYIVKTIPNKITINQRKLYITPDSNQGFMYGNYETGKVVAPITYSENYVETGTTKTETKGLVNGNIYGSVSGDTVTNQVALCIYDISERFTCFNDRQNGGAVANSNKYVTTGLHESSGQPVLYNSAPVGTEAYLHYNVYNDNYTEDNDSTRFALNRSLDTDTNARYNRNVGIYTITAGELVASTAESYCGYNSNTVNCLNTNYKIVAFEEGVTYEITPATIVITPDAGQSKIYGESDVELTFSVKTYFTLATPNADLYYCNSATCQTNSFNNKDTVNSTESLIILNGFAYTENITEGTPAVISNHNYGLAKQGNKQDVAQAITSVFSSDSGDNPKYYDKYCKDQSAFTGTCSAYSYSHQYASLVYTSTNRILLGYFYVENWDQKSADDNGLVTHNILNGIVVARNQFNNVNYKYKTSNDASDAEGMVGLGDDTNVDFTINKLDISVSIVDVDKVYGQATDSHKCDTSVTYAQCSADYATLNAIDNEGRLEYNFNIQVGSSSENKAATVEVSGVNKVVMVDAIENNYYTETSLPEYKNVHLGLTVVRAINNANTCIRNNDKFGCEDAGVYTLVFRKEAVTNTVDKNYNIKIGNSTIVTESASGYATVGSANISYDERDGKVANTTEVSYIKYANTNSLDTATSGQNSANENNSTAIDIVSGYTSAKLTIRQRNIAFYVGTYDDADNFVVAQRYVIEQNEQVPELPRINALFTTSTTNPASKAVYNTTWFDMNEYSQTISDNNLTYAPRQVRTADTLITTAELTNNYYGVAICTEATNDVANAVYGTGSCAESVYYGVSNNIKGDGSYEFDTSRAGNYPIVRDRNKTYIYSVANEARNYITKDYNGVLVIYEDSTAPVIQVGNSNFAIEANANTATNCSVVNATNDVFSYNCTVSGKLFDENGKSLGNIINYLTNYFSDYNNTGTSRNRNEETANRVLPNSLSTISDGWAYQPVNNIGIKSSDSPTTLYDIYRSANTYDFDGDYIDSNLEAISSIISWFNINSYDYAYIRGNSFSTYKRYTPRYYIFIGGSQDNVLSEFDPTYVGDFTITIYAIDNVGNQSNTTVTLNIVDTTTPVTGEMHLFNSPVECSATNCKTNSISSWTVKAGYVSIDNFIKYTSGGVEDDSNGTYIKLNGTLTYLYGDSIIRYSYNGSNYVRDILGKFVQVTAGTTPAVEVEHKSWSNNSTKYLVVVGGEDNSYIDPAQDDTHSQWNTYYTIDGGTNWYKYNRHNNEGVAITFKDGVTSIYTRVLDSGRRFEKTLTENGYVYYNHVYLVYAAAGSECSGLTNCGVVTGTQDITQVKNAPITTVTSGSEYTFNIQSIPVTYTINGDSKIVTWPTQNQSVNVDSDNKFRFGIMTCTIDLTNSRVDCTTPYRLVYNTSSNDRVTEEQPVYALTNDPKIAAWDSVSDENIPNFYKDRRYIFVDTAAPTFALNGDGYSIFEYDSVCAVGATDNICDRSYAEEFLSANDGLNSTNATSAVSAGNVALDSTIRDINGVSIISNLNITGYTNVIVYGGSTYSKITDTGEYATSGLLADSSLVMAGTSTLTNREIVEGVETFNATTFNKQHIYFQIYLNATDNSGNSTKYRYTVVNNGSAFLVYRQTTETGSSYTLIEAFDGTYNSSYTTIESVIEYLVSTAGVAANELKNHLTFSINYYIKDAANNVSAPIANVTVRGVTYTKLTTTIAPSVTENTGVALNSIGNNAYSLVVTQGVSLNSLLTGLTVSNINNEGVNNLATIKQSLYYNGEAIFEGLPFTDNIAELISDYAVAPGKYTLLLTSQREVMSRGNTYLINDDPLELNFIINPAISTTESRADYSQVIAISVVTMILAMSIMVIGYTVIRKKEH